jgi:hypothetical protein
MMTQSLDLAGGVRWSLLLNDDETVPYWLLQPPVGKGAFLVY